MRPYLKVTLINTPLPLLGVILGILIFRLSFYLKRKGLLIRCLHYMGLHKYLFCSQIMLLYSCLRSLALICFYSATVPFQ